MNLRRNKYAFLLTGALALTQFSCNKLLDLQPQDQLSDASYWQSANDFLLAANQSYTYLRTFNDVLYDTYPSSNPTRQNYHADYKADLLSGANLFSRGQNSVASTDPVYTLTYQRIRNINYLLSKAATYPTPAEISKYVAEARFFRAYEFFELLQVYGGVPIVDKLLDTSSPELQNPRNTRDEVTDFIIADLRAALAGVPAKAAQVSTTEQGRINQETVQAFLSRVTLYEGTWQKTRSNTARANTLLDIAVTASNTVITGAQYSVFAPTALGDSAQKYLFILEDVQSNPRNITKTANTEYILANRYSNTQRYIGVNVATQAASSSATIPTKNLANMYLCSDGLPIDKSAVFKGFATPAAEFLSRDNRMRYTLRIPGRRYWFGFSNSTARVDFAGGAADQATSTVYNPVVASFPTGYANQKWVSERSVPATQESYDYPVIRYAEVLLNYAEAVYEKNGSISDADLDKSLNLVRQRVNKTMPKLSNALVSANGLSMQTEIRRERTVEFFYEGFRVDDLKRWNTAATVLKQPLLGIKWTGTAYQTTWTAQAGTPKDADGNLIVDPAANRMFSDKNYLLPLPTQQIQLNPNLSQNPGW